MLARLVFCALRDEQNDVVGSRRNAAAARYSRSEFWLTTRIITIANNSLTYSGKVSLFNASSAFLIFRLALRNLVGLEGSS